MPAFLLQLQDVVGEVVLHLFLISIAGLGVFAFHWGVFKCLRILKDLSK